MTYRTEIDGLRAISVLAVILFHAKFSFISGGLAGVDVFFVISGYLIGGQILKELEAGQFNYRYFYARRARRILPALFAAILASSLVGYFVLLQNDYRYFFGAAFSSLMSISNFWFMDQIDYFNPEAALSPLVHTWSLGVEEQFYLFTPIVLSLAWFRCRRFLPLILITLVLASLALMLVLIDTAPAFTFYMLPTRAWELFAGILVAVAIGQPWWIACRSRHGLLGLLGLLILLSGLILTPQGVVWPGLWTTVPVVGTLLVLLFGQSDTATKTILSSAPMRFIGLISYSAYLWHQPVISFLEYTKRMPTTALGRALVVLFVFGLAAVSWRIIEQPFRKGVASGWWGKAVLITSAIAIFVIALGGSITKGYPSRIPQQITEFVRNAQVTGPYNKPCLLSRSQVAEVDIAQGCIIGPATEPTVALWGDSHAAATSDALAASLAQSGETLQTFMLSSCLPIPRLLNHSQSRQEQCPAFNARVEDHIIASDSIETVILFATWDSYFLRDGHPNMFGYVDADGFYAYPEQGAENMPEGDRIEGIQAAFERLITRLADAGKTIIVLHSVPRPNVDIPRFFARLAWAGDGFPDNSGYPVEYFNDQTSLSRRIIDGLAVEGQGGAGSVIVVDPAEILCDDALCYVIKDGVVLFSDGNHPSMMGSLLYSDLITSAIER
ncbi:MAG: acyltransferase family protein [Halocynthiibacter sp.]